MSDPILNSVLAHQFSQFPNPSCMCGLNLADTEWAHLPYSEAHARHVASAIQEGRTIRTFAELEALPDGAVLFTDDQYGKRAFILPYCGTHTLPAEVLWAPEAEL